VASKPGARLPEKPVRVEADKPGRKLGSTSQRARHPATKTNDAPIDERLARRGRRVGARRERPLPSSVILFRLVDAPLQTIAHLADPGRRAGQAAQDLHHQQGTSGHENWGAGAGSMASAGAASGRASPGRQCLGGNPRPGGAATSIHLRPQSILSRPQAATSPTANPRRPPTAATTRRGAPQLWQMSADLVER
jgi:hypothetical protein